jgi:hypothetical protein
MDIVLPVEYRRETSYRRRGKCIRQPNLYTNYYFGKDANLIQNGQELSIYRGTFRNLSTLSGITYPNLPNTTNNPIKATQDTTTLQNKSVGASYDILSTQTEGNRAYNLLNTQDEYDRYEENKTFKEDKFKQVCVKPLKILRVRVYCRQRENQGNGTCNP